jgi:predicted NBD/HSP70 family sugar kinase
VSRSIEPLDRHEVVRRANVELVFRAIGEQGPISRNDLVRVTGLSKPTVLAVVAALEDEGLVHGVPLPSNGAGRTPLGYAHNPVAAYVIGIDLGGTKVAAAIADLSGAVLAEREEITSQEGGAALVRQLAAIAKAVTRDAGVAWSRVDAVAVGSPGVVGPDGTLDLASNVNLAAIGEMYAGVARRCSTFALLALGTGAGAGLVIDGRLVRGSRGGAGEVAFLPIGADPASTEARRRGAFETAVSGSGVQALLVDELARRNGTATTLRRSSDARAVFAAAAAGDPVGVAVVERHAGVVAQALLAIAALLDPEMVVLGGGIGSNPVLLGPVRAAVERVVPWPLRVETSALGSRAGLIGSVHHALASLPDIESHRVSARLQEEQR